jgi:hypothetical protein
MAVLAINGNRSPSMPAPAIREAAAWAAHWQANGYAGQAWAQLNVYAADPSYASAMKAAETAIDAGLGVCPVFHLSASPDNLCQLRAHRL